MKILSILQADQSVLHQKARALSIDEIKSEEIQTLIESMKETMRAAPGVGLAAPQIGLPLQIAVIEDNEERLNTIPLEIRKDRNRKPVAFHVIINPILTILSEKNNFFFEGCLSVNNCARITPRADRVRVDCVNEKGEAKTIIAEGWYARILQHEIDHLNGRLYTDFADERTEIAINEETRQKWLNASTADIQDYFKTTCPDKVCELEKSVK